MSGYIEIHGKPGSFVVDAHGFNRQTEAREITPVLYHGKERNWPFESLDDVKAALANAEHLDPGTPDSLRTLSKCAALAAGLR